MKITITDNKPVSFAEIAEGTVFRDPPRTSIISKLPQWLIKIPTQKDGILSAWIIMFSPTSVRDMRSTLFTMRNSLFLDKPDFCLYFLFNGFSGCLGTTAIVVVWSDYYWELTDLV